MTESVILLCYTVFKQMERGAEDEIFELYRNRHSSHHGG